METEWSHQMNAALMAISITPPGIVTVIIPIPAMISATRDANTIFHSAGLPMMQHTPPTTSMRPAMMSSMATTM